MKRNVDLSEISDGKLYELNDLVKADCNDCKGCSSCCQGMGNSIILDPLDIHRMVSNLNSTFQELLINKIELNVVDGIILPNLRMEETTEKCSFLNTQGRCNIHSYRPGICRLFPLGRYYEDHSFKYFLQVHECENKNKTKIKVRKWIDTPNPKKYEQFILDWHYFLKDLEDFVQQSKDDEQIKEVNMVFLNKFFLTPYDVQADFYEQFNERLNELKEVDFARA